MWMTRKPPRSPRPRTITVEVREKPAHLRLAPGDIIRCSAFASGLRWRHDPEGPVQVAWRAGFEPDHYVRDGRGDLANDPSRAKASFLVYAVTLDEASGPDDIAPGEHRLSRELIGLRLGDDFAFARDAERIRFALNEPMSVASPDEATIEVVGYAVLPITWREGA